MNCKKYRLEDLLEIKYGKDKKRVESADGQYPIFGTGGLMGWSKEYLYDKPSILIGRKGTINKVKFVDEPFWTVDTLFWTKIDSSIVDPKYLYYALYCINFNDYNEGTTVPSLRTDTLNRIELMIPDKRDQAKIAKVLSALDQKIKQNESTIQSLYDLGRMLFDDYAKKTNNHIKATDKLSFESGIEPGSKSYHKEATRGSIRFIRVGDMLNSTPENYVNEELCQNCILEEHDVVMSFDATIGRVSYGISGGYSSGLKKVSSINNDLPNAFIYYYLTSDHVQKVLLENATGTTILHAGKAVKYFELPYDKNAITILIKKLAPIFNKQLTLKRQNVTLSDLRDTLLPRLLSGAINIDKVDV